MKLSALNNWVMGGVLLALSNVAWANPILTGDMTQDIELAKQALNS